MKLPTIRRNSPLFQNIAICLVLFACPGLYGAITGLGAGGGKPSSLRVANITNCTVYACYAFFSFFAGGIINLLGVRWTFTFGACTYILYAAGFWIYDRTALEGAPIAFGALLGIGAAMLWTNAAFVSLAYSDERKKGKYIASQWTSTAIGSFIGAIIAFGFNYNGQENEGSPTAVYLIFIIIMVIAIILSALVLIHPRDVRRSDGSPLANFHKPSIKQELLGYKHVLTDWRTIAIFVVASGAEICLALQSSMNAYWFNLRTRSLTNVCFWLIQIPATIMMRYLFDAKSMTRKTRAFIATTVLLVVINIAWITETVWIHAQDVDRNNPSPAVDWTSASSRFGPLFVGYLFSGITYALWQSVVQWVISCLSNDPGVSARNAGIFKAGITSGMSISFGVDSAEVPYWKQFAWQWTLQMVGLILLYAICTTITATNYFKESDVIVPTYLADEAAQKAGTNIDKNISTVESSNQPVDMKKTSSNSTP